MITSKISLKASATGPGLTLTVKIDDTVIYQGQPGADPVSICHELQDGVDAPHRLALIMSGKQFGHTRINSSGEITEDRVIMISDLAFDDIELGHIFMQQAQYHHDFNGTKPPVTDRFFGVMGCNGEVHLDFTSPIYLWLLENM